MSISLSIKLEIEDWYKFQSYIEKELIKSNEKKKSWKDGFWLNVIIWIVIAFVFFSAFKNINQIHWTTVGMVSMFFIITIILFVFHLKKLKKVFAPSDSGVFVGEHHFDINEEGINSHGQGYESKQNWSIVQRIERAEGMILVFLDTAYAYVFPESKLENPEQLYNYISEQYNKYQLREGDKE